MTDPRPDDIDRVIEKASHLSQFSPEEVRALKLVADAWRGLEAFGRVATVVRKILMWVGWAIAFYLTLRAGVVDFVKGII